MPWYDYSCQCGNRREVCKAHSQLYETIEMCEVCGHVMKIEFSGVNFIMRKDAVSRDEQKRYNDKTGSHMIQVGDEDLNKYMKKTTDYSERYDKAYKEVVSEL